jgi:hypothetical protein
MRVMVIGKASEGVDKVAPPTPEGSQRWRSTPS